MKKLFAFVILIFFFVMPIGATKLEKVSLQLQWLNQFQFAGYYMAKEKGFYKDVGLDVNIKNYRIGENVASEVLSGKSQYGIGRNSLIINASRGNKVYLLAAIFQSSPLALIAKKTSRIKTLNDLKNKKFMLSIGIEESASIFAMLLSHGISKKDIFLVLENDRIKSLISNQVDVISAYISNETYTLRKKHIDISIFNPKDYGFNFYGDLLFTNENEVTYHRKRVENFTKASIKGWTYAFNHIQETVNIIYNKYNTQHKTKEALLYEAKILKKLAYYRTDTIGKLNKNKIQRIYDTYKVMGFIKNKIDIGHIIVIPTAYSITKKEKQYLTKKQILKVCTNPNWKPIEFTENSKPTGISIDILKIATKKINIKLDFIKTSSWSESQKFLKEKKCDLLPAAIKTKQRLKYANFTKPYLIYNLAIITKKDKPLINDLKSIIDKPMSRKRASGLIAKLKNKYPNINIIETDGYKEAFKKVENNEAYFTIATIPVLSYYKEVYGFNDLQIAGYTKMQYKLAMAVRKDDKTLLSILNKTLQNIPKYTINIIYNKWTAPHVVKKNNYGPIWKMSLMFSAILLVILYLYIKQKKLKNKLKILNDTLEKRIEEEVAKNRQYDKKLFRQARLAQMGEMLSMIAHQWRQPLAAISATTSNLKLKFMLNEIDLETCEQEIDLIDRYSQHLSKTIDDFRNFFKQNKRKKTISLKYMIENTLYIIKNSLENKNIRVIKSIDCDIDVKTYPNEVIQVILNLLKNAEDALLEKKIANPTIEISTVCTNNTIKIEIEDNAGGIPKNIKDKIFDLYFSTKLEKDGTGLGLYMSKIIIEQHCGGKLYVNNSYKGAVFTIELYCKEKCNDKQN